MKYFLCFLILIFFVSCSNKQSESSMVDSDCIIINLDEKRGSSIPLSTYFNSVQAIILETKDECLIGRINELQVFDGYIYVLDSRIAKSLFVFDMNGHFIRKIGGLGNGPGEYNSLEDFTLDTENGFIFLLDFGKRVHKYHLNGTFIQTITPELRDKNANNIQFYKNKLYLCIDAYRPSPNDNMLLEIDPDNGKILSSKLPIKHNKGWGHPSSTGHNFFMSRLNDPPRYTRLYMDEIVTIGDSITPFIKLKSKDLSTLEDLNNLQHVTPNFEMNFMRFTKIWDVRGLLENDDFIIFRYRHALNSYTVIYNKKTETVELTDYLYNDLIFKNKGTIESSPDFMFSDSKGVYEILSGRLFTGFLENTRNNEIIAELDKLEQLSKLESNANPVIFYYEYK